MSKRSIKILICALIVGMLLSACTKSGTAVNQITTLQELSDRTLSTQNGTVFSLQIKENEELKDCEVIYGQTTMDAFALLLSGKSDGFVVDNLVAKSLARKENVLIVEESIAESAYAIGIPKESPLKDKINNTLAEMKEDGTLDILSDKWFDEDESKTVSEDLWVPIDNADGTLICVENSELDDVCYRDADGNLQGFDIEMVLIIAHKLNYNVEFREVQFDDIIPELAAGHADVAVSGIDVTEERRRYIDFSDEYLDVSTVVVVRDASKISLGGGMLFSARNSVKRVVSEEDRWKDIAKGLLVTFLLTAGSVVLGTLFGIVLFLIYYSESKVGRKLVDILDRFVTLLPISLRMMLWFYIFFAHGTGVTNFIAGILALSVGFALLVYYSLSGAIASLDDNQRIAARAMGFSKYETLKKILLPQAWPQIVNDIEPLVIGQIKDTTLVGFIAVQDLQYVLDGISSRTEEFVAPILISLLVYLAFEELICLLIRAIISTARKRRVNRKKHYFNAG